MDSVPRNRRPSSIINARHIEIVKHDMAETLMLTFDENNISLVPYSVTDLIHRWLILILMQDSCKTPQDCHKFQLTFDDKIISFLPYSVTDLIHQFFILIFLLDVPLEFLCNMSCAVEA